MVMSRSVAVGSIVTGSIMIAFAIVTVICGVIASQKLTNQAAASVGFWSLYYAVPGVLSIVAGASKSGIVMGFALFFNIIAVILSSAAAVVLILFVSLMNQVVDFHSSCYTVGESCTCVLNDDSTTRTWNMKCNDLQTIHSLFIALLIVFVIISITTFTASIYGCMGTCCAPMDQVVVTTGVPVQAGGTIVVSNQSSMHSGYAGYPGGYVQAPPPGYGYGHGYGDKQGLVQNMAI